MIIDDLVRDIPKLKDLIGEAVIVRVPWHLDACENDDDMLRGGWMPKNIPQQLVPVSQAGFVSWDGLRLPYQKLVIVSEFSERSLWIVETGYLDQGSDVTLCIMAVRFRGQRLALNIVPFHIDRDTQQIYSPFYVDESNPNEEARLRHNAAYFAQLTIDHLDKLGYTSVHSADFMAESYLSPHGRLGKQHDFFSYSSSLTAIAALFSAKNIVAKEVIPGEDIQTKRVKRGLLPLYRYHVLQVRLSTGAAHSLTGTGEAVAIHWVRGHFKRYTEAHKLFGKYTGLYWWQPHIAGTASRVVEKDYALHATEAVRR